MPVDPGPGPGPRRGRETGSRRRAPRAAEPPREPDARPSPTRATRAAATTRRRDRGARTAATASAQGLDRQDLDAPDQTGLVGGRAGHDDRPDASTGQDRDHRQHAGHGADLAAERQLTDHRDPARARPGPAPSRAGSPMAIARSSDEPAFRSSAGARLTVIRRGGWMNPALRSAPRTRSRASWSAVSARPTIVKPGRPGATSTSTRMNRPSRPNSVADGTMASTRPPYRGTVTGAHRASSAAHLPLNADLAGGYGLRGDRRDRLVDGPSEVQRASRPVPSRPS